MKMVNFFVLAILISLSMVGCEGDEACLSNQHSVQAEFVSAWSAIDTTLIEVSVVGLTPSIDTALTDSVYRNQNLSELFMPLDFENDTTSFILSAQTLRDTIRFVHRSELDFISGECGFIFSFHIDTVLHTNAFVDSVSISYPEVIYGESTENIQFHIY